MALLACALFIPIGEKLLLVPEEEPILSERATDNSAIMHFAAQTRDGRSDMTNFEMDLLDTRMHSAPSSSEHRHRACKNSFIRPSCIPIAVIVAFVVLVVLFPTLQETLNNEQYTIRAPCTDQCEFHLVESIPEGLVYPTGSPLHMSTSDAWQKLILSATHRISIAAFYWTLRGKDVVLDPTSAEGDEIYRLLHEAGARGVGIRIAQNDGDPSQLSDSADLAKERLAKVRNLNFTRWFNGGILHTKLWIVDRKHFYVGSANTDWRSLTQVKELGAAVFNCSCLAEDLQKIFDVYWHMGDPAVVDIPKPWPPGYESKYNASHPLPVALNGTLQDVYFSSSPFEFCPHNRQVDLSAILTTIASATEFIHIAVMDYSPTTLYEKPRRYWPKIDDALRSAAFDRGVKVRILASKWNHTRSDMLKYLQSLVVLNGALMRGSIEVKLFEVPVTSEHQRYIPFSRVNHNKYMVTDNTAYIGTSNWSGDYFLTTAGVGFVVTCYKNESAPRDYNRAADSACQTEIPIVHQLQDVFDRDWNSEYAKHL